MTRHPMMWGFALWSLGHIALWWSWRTMIVASAILLLALVGAHFQDRKKEALMGTAWAKWEAKTSYWPRWGRLLVAGAVLWLASIALWLLATWAHIRRQAFPPVFGAGPITRYDFQRSANSSRRSISML